MAKPALVIDMLAPSAEEEPEASASADPDALGASKSDPEALIADIRAQLSELEALVGGLR